MSATPVDTIDATPSKRLYLSIMADYDLKLALCELIDNAVDLSQDMHPDETLTVDITLDVERQLIQIVDNAGGIPKDRFRDIVAPGHTGNTGQEETIGIFGVGTKRATVALAQEVRIRTRVAAGDTYEIRYDDAWIHDADNWEVPVLSAPDIHNGTTVIELLMLRTPIALDDLTDVTEHIAATYGKLLETDRLCVTVNTDSVEPVLFEDWAYPPGYEPRHYTGPVPTSDGTDLQFDALAGLCKSSHPTTGDYGVYVYCNERLVARALKTIDVGFATKLAGRPHPDISLTRVIVSLNGPAHLMPWNSSKSNIRPDHEVFAAIRPWLVEVVRDYASLSRRFNKAEGGWPDNVFAHDKGEKKAVPVADIPNARTSYLPPLPTARPRSETRIPAINKQLARDKPWVTGLYEGVIAVEVLGRKSLQQKNRLNLIILDSTLEIAFKEFLVNEVDQRYSEDRLAKVMANRVEVHNEVSKHKKLARTDWQKIEYYYNMRCQLIHRRATAQVSDSDIESFRKVVEKVLRKLFKLKF